MNLLARELAKKLRDRESVIALVRERAELRFGIPAVHGTYQAGYAAAMNDILRSLEGDSDE